MFTARAGSRPRFVAVTAVFAAVALSLAACSSSGSDEEADETTSTSTTTTTAEATTTTGDGAAEATEATEATSETDPADFRGEIGKQVTYRCPAAGSASSIWGVEIYTDDSSVCTAAVHVGLLTFADGGDVTIEIAEGQSSYEAGTANGVTSRSYGEWGGSFTFPEAPPGSGEFAPSAESWSINARELAPGETKAVTCSPDGLIGSVWGTGTYTADSSVCSAAVHAGLITLEEGGTVTVEGAGGLDEYEGSESNGVTSKSYGSYGSSFTFPEA